MIASFGRRVGEPEAPETGFEEVGRIGTGKSASVELFRSWVHLVGKRAIRGSDPFGVPRFGPAQRDSFRIVGNSSL